MRVALGTAVFSGMLGVTVFGIFFTPVFYSVIRWFTERSALHRRGTTKVVPAFDGAAATPAAAKADGYASHPDETDSRVP